MSAGVGKEEMAPGQRSGQWGLGSGGRKQRLGHQAWLGPSFGGKRAGGAAWRGGGEPSAQAAPREPVSSVRHVWGQQGGHMGRGRF